MGQWTEGLPDQVVVQVGQAETVPLPSAAGGYQWTLSPGVEGAEVVVGDVPPPADAPRSSTAPTALVVTGTTVGEATLVLALVRPFAPDQPLARHVLVVRTVT
jgi:hypothetical protein